MSRLRARLQALERAAAGTALSLDASQLLVRLLGRFHAMWWPFREHEGSFRAELRRVQLEYLAGVGGLAAKSQGSTNWKAGHHARNELIGSGLATALEAGGQVIGLRLTRQGIADASAMVGDRLHAIDDPKVQYRLAQLRSFDGCDHSGEWMIENQLFGDDVVTSADPNDWDHEVEYMIPLIACGAVETTSDLWHRAYYRATDVDPPESLPPSVCIQYAAWADDVYIAAYNGERAAIRRWECLGGNLFIPMRCT